MKIIINEDLALTETEITINCKQINEQVLKILTTLRAFDKKLTGIKNGETFLIESKDVLYCDTVDKNVFIYTANEVYETPLRLYELEDRLDGCDFFRISKSVIINLNKIKTLKPDFGGRIETTLISGEKLFISRQYASKIKQVLDI